MSRRAMRLVVAVFWFLAFAAAAPAQGSAQNSQWNALDNFIHGQMQQWKVPGMAVGIVQDGKTVYVKGFGVRDIRTRQPVTPNTLFDIGSCTKAFTAASIAILVDEGKMHWDDHVDDYIPFFHLYDPLADENVTIRDLLTHRTGMGGTDLLWYGSSYTLEDILHRVRYIQPTAGFRARFQYQNVMYAAAGYAAGRAAGESWEDLVRTKIFEPLGMSGADFSAEAAQAAPDHATPHREDDNGAVKAVAWRNLDNVAPAGSINSGVADMARWIAMQLNDGQLNDGAANGGQLISARSMSQMHSPQIVVPQGGEFALFFPPSLQLSYGMGWFIEDYHGHEVILHPGDIDGFASLVMLLPEVHTGFVILTNLDHTPVRSGLGWHLVDEFLNLPQQDWTQRFASVADRFEAAGKKEEQSFLSAQHPDTHPSHELAAYAGTYTNRAYGNAAISLDGDQLEIQFHSFNSRLRHFQYDTFAADFGEAGGKSLVLFTSDVRGNVAKLTLDGIEFDRTENARPH